MMKKKPSAAVLARLQGLWRQHPRYNRCVAHWLFHEGRGTTIHDISGNNFHGEMENMDPATDWVVSPGAGGYALSFDGTNDIVRITGTATLPRALDLFTHEGPFSYVVWYRTSDVIQGGTLICSRDGSIRTFQMAHQINAAQDRFFLAIDNASTQYQTVYSSGDFLTQDVWHCISATVTADNFIYLHTNGGPEDAGTYLQTAGPQPVEFRAIAQDISIGARWQGDPTTGYQHTGEIAQIRVYRREIHQADALSFYTDPYREFHWAQQQIQQQLFKVSVAAGGRVMSSLVGHGGLVADGGLAGRGGGLAG